MTTNTDSLPSSAATEIKTQRKTGVENVNNPRENATASIYIRTEKYQKTTVKVTLSSAMTFVNCKITA